MVHIEVRTSHLVNLRELLHRCLQHFWETHLLEMPGFWSRLKQRLNEIYVEHTGKALKDIEENLERDRFMDVHEAKEYGLIDAVITKRAQKEDTNESSDN